MQGKLSVENEREKAVKDYTAALEQYEKEVQAANNEALKKQAEELRATYNKLQDEKDLDVARINAELEKVKRYLNALNSDNIKAQYHTHRQNLNQEKPTTTQVHSDAFDEILKDYEKQFKKDNKYPGDLENLPQHNGKPCLVFPTPKEMGAFFQSQAELNRDFIVVNMETQQVIAYSKEGKLYHGNGTLYKAEEEGKFVTSGKSLDEFLADKQTNNPKIK